MTHIKHEALLGPPGSGKTWYINEELKKDERFGFKTASTGVAALIATDDENIMGRTIHSVLRFVHPWQLKENIKTGKINKTLAWIASNYDRLIIDEISMISAELFDLIVYAVNEYNSDGRNIPLKLLVVGDFLQLPPISMKEEELALPAFMGEYWKDFEINKLTEIRRQDNSEFLEVIKAIREDRAKEAVEWIENNIGFHPKEDKEFKGSSIFSTNKTVNAFNQDKLDRLIGKERKYKSVIEGEPPSIASRIPKEIVLKEGALVSIGVNNLKRGYANGSQGEVVELNKTSVKVRVFRTNEIETIGFNTQDNIVPETKKNIGYITYMPLKLAYATTVHSCQGLTIEGGLQCKLGDPFLRRLHGGLHVILSRCKNPFDYRLIGSRNSFIKSNYIDPLYKQWC